MGDGTPVTGKVLTPQDQQRLAEEVNQQLARLRPLGGERFNR